MNTCEVPQDTVQQGVLGRIGEKAQQPVLSRWESVTNTFVDILKMPGTMERLVEELSRLNGNLEALRGLPGQVGELIEVMEDFRKMAAPLLGYRVKR